MSSRLCCFFVRRRFTEGGFVKYAPRYPITTHPKPRFPHNLPSITNSRLPPPHLHGCLHLIYHLLLLFVSRSYYYLIVTPNYLEFSIVFLSPATPAFSRLTLRYPRHPPLLSPLPLLPSAARPPMRQIFFYPQYSLIHTEPQKPPRQKKSVSIWRICG